MSDDRHLQLLRELAEIGNSKNIPGAFKGIVEDVNDPLHMNRARVRVYQIHSDYDTVATKDLPWSEPAFAMRGMSDPPELFDRVWVIFENGDRSKPIYFGRWYATPDGSGKLPFNRKKGLETPSETWHYHKDHHPQCTSIFRTGEGDQLWVEDIEFNNNFLNKITLADTGGKHLRVVTRRLGSSKDYRPSGKYIKDTWGPETVYRKNARELMSSKVFHTGEVSLSGADYTLEAYSAKSQASYIAHNHISGGKLISDMSYNGSKKCIAVKGASAGCSGSLCQNSTIGDITAFQSSGKMSINSLLVILPEVW